MPDKKKAQHITWHMLQVLKTVRPIHHTVHIMPRLCHSMHAASQQSSGTYCPGHADLLCTNCTQRVGQAQLSCLQQSNKHSVHLLSAACWAGDRHAVLSWSSPPSIISTYSFSPALMLLPEAARRLHCCSSCCCTWADTSSATCTPCQSNVW